MTLVTPELAVEQIQDAAVRYCAAKVAARAEAPAAGNVLPLAQLQVARVRRELHEAGLAYDAAANRARLDFHRRFHWRRLYFAA